MATKTYPEQPGRGTRSDSGRKLEVELWDVRDVGHPWLVRHSRERMRAFIAEGYEVVEETIA